MHLREVHKSFKLPHEQYHTLKQRAIHGFRGGGYDVLHAVHDVTVDIAEGEFFGIVGRNGSGKSTLLKCLAGVYRVDSGEMGIRGRLAPFIELGVGFNAELTARDNAIINAVMLGLSRKEAEARLDDIVAFAELEEFMDLKLKNFSSGMHVRLAFSVAIQVDADILLIDEVLAVGDANFAQKCFDQFTRLQDEGRTIIFVTHDMGSVERFCDRAMLMDRGRVIDIGEPDHITREYNKLNFRRVRAEAQETGGPATWRQAPVAEIVSARFLDADGKSMISTTQGEANQVEIEVAFHQDITDPAFSISLHDDLGKLAFATSSGLDDTHTGSFRAGQSAAARIDFANWLAPGRYSLTVAVARDWMGDDVLDIRPDITTIIVFATHSGGGAFDPPHAFEILRD